MSQSARRMKEMHTERTPQSASPPVGVPFSAEDLADIADCFERQTGHCAWVGYGFADPSGQSTIYLFSAGAEGGRLTLRQTDAGTYELKGFNGDLLWTGPRLADFMHGLTARDQSGVCQTSAHRLD